VNARVKFLQLFVAVTLSVSRCATVSDRSSATELVHTRHYCLAKAEEQML